VNKMYTPKNTVKKRIKFILKTYKQEKKELDPRIVFDEDISWAFASDKNEKGRGGIILL